ncbi:MAG: oligosaccharide flippase family protein [Pyrinomonadaceae bacterium]
MPIRNLISKPFGLRSSIAVNIAANVVSAIVFIASVPLYLPYIGVEAYGLVGIFVALQGVLMVLDLGLNVAITREFAVKGNDPTRSGEIHDLLRTAEIFYWVLTVLTALVWLTVARTASTYVNPEGLSPDTVYNCFLIMGIPLALQFPLSLYSAGLYGMQRQALVSGIGVVFAVARSLGVVAALRFISASPETYFIWNAGLMGLQVPVLALALRWAMPATDRKPRFESSMLTSQWRFVAGIGVVTLASTILLQTDKFVLARMFPLEVFGFYSLAATVAAGLQWLVQPVFRGVFPQLAQSAETGDQTTLTRVYHQGCQIMAIIILPISTVLVFFSWETMMLWQRNPETASNTYISLSLLMAGCALNALLFVPYALQLAFSSTRLQLITLVAGLAVSIPTTIAFASYWGPPGAAAVWLILNVLFLAITVPLTHRRFLAGEAARWGVHDVLMPLSAAVVAGALAKYFYRETDSFVLIAVQLAMVFGFVSICCVLASDIARNMLFRHSETLT